MKGLIKAMVIAVLAMVFYSILSLKNCIISF